MKELSILNINSVDYEISDSKARESVDTIKQKTVVTGVTLNSVYTDISKTLTLNLQVNKKTIGG